MDYKNNKKDFSKVLLGLTHLGYRIVFLDEYSMHDKYASNYRWVKVA